MATIQTDKRCCVNCQFLGLAEGHFDELKNRQSLAPSEREPLKVGAHIDVMRTGQLTCCMGVWRVVSGAHPTSAFAIHDQLEIDRGNTCFFFPVSKGMTIDAAEELERRQSASHEAEMDRDLNRRALGKATTAIWVSVIAVGITGALELASLGWQIWEHFHPYQEPVATMSAEREIALPVLTSSTNRPAGKSSCVEVLPVNSFRNTAIYCLP